MKIKDRTVTGLAIVGPFGNIWDDRIFDDEAAAYAHLDSFWGARKWEPEKWSIVLVTQTISVAIYEGRPVEPWPLQKPEAVSLTDGQQRVMDRAPRRSVRLVADGEQ